MPRDTDKSERANLMAALAGVAMHGLLSGPAMAKLLEEGATGKAAHIAKLSADMGEALLAEIERRAGPL